MTFEAILFDCDGVLVDSEIVGLEDAAEFLRGHGFSWGPEDLIRRFNGMRMDRFADELRRAYEEVLGQKAAEADFQALLKGMIEARRANRHKMTIVEGAMGSVAAAHASDLPLAVASSSAQVFLDDKIQRYGFASYFGPHVYSADVVQHGKPEPDIFLFAAERLAVSAQNCLIIEDSAHGVSAGVAAGATVWGFTGGGHCLPAHPARLEESGAVRILSNHSELAKALSEL